MTITDEGIRVDLPFIELIEGNKRVNPVVKECYLLLHKDYLQYKIIANYATVDTDDELLKEYKSNFRYTRLKSSISSIEMYKDNKHNTWAVGIEYLGVEKMSEWDFTDVADCRRVYDILVDYFISR